MNKLKSDGETWCSCCLQRPDSFYCGYTSIFTLTQNRCSIALTKYKGKQSSEMIQICVRSWRFNIHFHTFMDKLLTEVRFSSQQTYIKPTSFILSHHPTVCTTCLRCLFAKIKIQASQDCWLIVSKGNKLTNSSSFKNQSGRHLSNFPTTALSISLLVSYSLYHIATSPANDQSHWTMPVLKWNREVRNAWNK